MRIDFTKMNGLGNDFVVLDARERALPALEEKVVRALADRRMGIGCDQLVLLEPSDAAMSGADFAMRIFNCDGGEVEACGNATRAVALMVGGPCTIATSAGLLQATPSGGGVAVDMGEPRFDWDAIPLSYPMDTLSMPVGWEELERPVSVNVGNPHVVFFVPDNDAVQLDRLGPLIERDPLFPEKVNVNIATVEDRETIRLRVWERGAGLTRACGTGACATAVAAMRRDLVGRAVEVILPGGSLDIEWGADNHITMIGPAEESFRGSFEWDDYA